MLLAIDIGNSNTLFGIFKGRKIISKFMFPTVSIAQRNFAYEITKGFKKKRIKLEDIDGIVVSSVVPEYTTCLGRSLRKIFKLKPLYVSPRLNLGIRIGYRNPRLLGQDRLANAVAAHRLYNGPVIIVDYGTAITICYITKLGYYRGGVILPGTDMITRTLATSAALLPYVKSLNRPKKLIGQDTKESILSGVVYGISEMVDGLIRKIKKEIKTRVKVISTGGVAKFFFPYSKEIDKIDRDLTLKGLYFIYEMNTQKCHCEPKAKQSRGGSRRL